jgi:hypothetical protein
LLRDFGHWLANHATVVSAVVSAIAAGVIAAFTVKLTRATSGQLEKLGESIALARDEFNATHRPELMVREVVWIPRGGGMRAIEFTVVNRGRNSCKIVESAFELTSGDLGGRAVRPEGKNEIGPATFVPGQFLPFIHELSEDEVFEDGFIEPMVDAAFQAGSISQCFFRGTIIYEDGVKIRRRYVFTRVCNTGMGSFVPTRRPDDEYTD